MRAFLATALVAIAFCRASYAAEPDFAYAGTGVAAGPVAGGSTAIRIHDGIAVDPVDDSAFLVYAHHMFPGIFVRMVRVKANGELDSSFGGRGYADVSVSFGGGMPTFGALGMDALRRLVVAYGSGGSMRLKRLSRSGVEDAGFGGAIPLSAVLDVVDVAIQPDGKILVVTGAHPPGTPPAVRRMVAMRYTDRGTLDESFGGTGLVDVFIEGSPDYNYASGVALAPDGKIVVAGTARRDGGRMDVVVTRLLKSNGGVDYGFGHLGVAIQSLGGVNVFARRVAVQADGSILVSATIEGASGDAKLATLRLRPDGALDPSYGYGGWMLGAIGAEQTVATDIAIQGDGKPVLAGFHDRSVPGSGDLAGFVMRQTTDGFPDTGFAAGGSMDVSLPTLYVDAYASAVGLDSAGRILVAGVTSNAFNSRWFVARFVP